MLAPMMIPYQALLTPLYLDFANRSFKITDKNQISPLTFGSGTPINSCRIRVRPVGYTSGLGVPSPWWA